MADDSKETGDINGQTLRRSLLSVISSCLAWAAIVSFLWILVDFVVWLFVDEYSSFYGLIELIPWYIFAGLAIVTAVSSLIIHRRSPEGKAEAEKAKAEAVQERERADKSLNARRRVFAAFRDGVTTDYPPPFDGAEFGFMAKPDEKCFIGTNLATIGRGNVHQLELSQQSSGGLQLHGVALGKTSGVKDTYTTIRYDEEHPGTLIVTNQRIVFLSAPSLFFEVPPDKIVTAAWHGNYFMIRTTLFSDDEKNVFSFRVGGDMPAWIFAAAAFRLGVDAKRTASASESPATTV